MIIEKFIIIDFIKKEANSFKFKQGANIICSENNTAGKSCLLKSLYYTLGLETNKFPNGWDYKNMIFKIYYDHNGHKGFITRLNDVFWIDNSDKSLLIKEYSTWLLRLLDIKMKLPLKAKEELSDVYAAAPLSLFYIDQDTSWSNGLYKNTANLCMYKMNSVPKNIFEYFLGISSDEIIDLEDAKTNLQSHKQILINQSGTLGELEDSFIGEEKKTTVFNERELKEEIRKYLKLASQMSEDIKKYKLYIYKKQISLDAIKLDLIEIKEVLRNLTTNYNKISSKCSQCNSELTVSQSIQRMKLDNNRVSLGKYKIDLERNVAQLEKEIENGLAKKLNIEHDYKKLLSIAEVKQGELTLSQYIKEKAKEDVKNIYCDIKNNLYIQEKDISKKISEINKQINQLNKAIESKKNEISKDFDKSLLDKRIIFSKANLDYNFLNFNAIKDSGAIKNQVFLCLYMVYTELLFKYSRIKIPFVLDSIIKDELDSDILYKSYSIVNDTILKSKEQTFVALLVDKLSFIDSYENYNKIEIKEKRLLLKDKYADLEGEIPNMK